MCPEFFITCEHVVGEVYSIKIGLESPTVI